MSRSRIMVVAATAAYNTEEFVRAAAELGVEVTLATDRCRVLAGVWWAGGAVPLDFRYVDRAARAIVRHARTEPLDGLIATDERTSMIAALAAAELGLRGNPPQAVKAAWNKRALRSCLRDAGLAQPETRWLRVGDDPGPLADSIGYPVVIKPLHLSGSRGVMRADDDAQLRQRCRRLVALLADPEVEAVDSQAATEMLLESFIAGPEVAVEGLLTAGVLEVLTIFDKPDPLDGPFFAETIYVTPTQLEAGAATAVEVAVADAARALGLREGPVHAEVRLAANGPIVLEVAARSIGGLCARTLRFGLGVSLEELVIRHAIGQELGEVVRTGAAASGVMMLPVPSAGVLREIEGVEEAAAMALIDDVVITARVGENVLPLPEGRSYMGFIFARGRDQDTVTSALRGARERIKFRIAPRL